MMFLNQAKRLDCCGKVPVMTTNDHFERVAPVYEALRTTDEAPVRWLHRRLPERPVIGVDVGCGTGRYSKLLAALLPEGSLLLASDASAAMLTELTASNSGDGWVAPMRSAAEDLPIRNGRLDLVSSFNSVHHFHLRRFLAEAARVLRPGGQLFIYTRTPEQNARTVWGRYFPGFVEHERRLYRERALHAAIRETKGLRLACVQTFNHARSSAPERLAAQAEGHHYSTFAFYAPDELRAAVAAFLARLPSSEVTWVDEHLMVVALRSHDV